MPIKKVNTKSSLELHRLQRYWILKVLFGLVSLAFYLYLLPLEYDQASSHYCKSISYCHQLFRTLVLWSGIPYCCHRKGRNVRKQLLWIVMWVKLQLGWMNWNSCWLLCMYGSSCMGGRSSGEKLKKCSHVYCETWWQTNRLTLEKNVFLHINTEYKGRGGTTLVYVSKAFDHATFSTLKKKNITAHRMLNAAQSTGDDINYLHTMTKIK